MKRPVIRVVFVALALAPSVFAEERTSAVNPETEVAKSAAAPATPPAIDAEPRAPNGSVHPPPVVSVEASRDSSEASVDRWYGWQVALSDAAAIGMMVMAIATRATSPAVGWAGVGVYALGGPVVHTAHAHGGKAAASLGLRIGLPAVGFLVGLKTAPLVDPPEREIDFRYPIAGIAIGMFAASAIDIAGLSHEEVESRREQPQSARITLSVGAANAPLGGSMVGTF